MKNLSSCLQTSFAGKGILCLFVLVANLNFNCFSQNTVQSIKGTVISEGLGGPLPGATVKVKNSNNGTSTNQTGNFTLLLNRRYTTLIISFIGYQSKEIKVDSTTLQPLIIILKEGATSLKGIEVSTGYQSILKDNSTGSFSVIDNKLFNRKPTTNVINGLEGITTSLLFDRRTSATNPSFSIRGNSTIYGNNSPLVVIDGMAYDGGLNNINPNDVESITFLKDAAAAAIWGVRAGNGVVLIKTKRAKLKQTSVVEFSSNVIVGNKPGLFYLPNMSTADFIESEIEHFNKGYYNGDETSYNKPALSPVIEILIKKRDGLINAQQADKQIADLKSRDVRNDFLKDVYRKSIKQQYALNFYGRTDNLSYYLSTGYDKGLESIKGNDNSRLSLKSQFVLQPVKKLELTAGLYYVMQGNNSRSSLSYQSVNNGGKIIYPYARLKDENGNNLPVSWDYRDSYIQEMAAKGFQNWNYSPLDEMSSGSLNSYKIKDNLINAGIKYEILNGLNAEAKYQYESSIENTKNLHSEQSYSTRDLINRYTQVGNTGVLTYPLPIGGIIDYSNAEQISQTFRGQLSFNREFKRKHNINAIVGSEVKEVKFQTNSSRVYGYNEDDATVRPVDYINYYPTNPNYNYSTIPDGSSTNSLIDRYISYYGNGVYTYEGKYSASLSGRIDQSNLFGVKANQRSVPLWSTGFNWNISKEQFFNLNWLSLLRLRTSYGYTGNVDKSTSAFATAFARINYLTNTRFVRIVNPPNPRLQWERTGIFNAGFDFQLKKDILSGSVEYYSKKGRGLIGTSLIDPTTGITNSGGQGFFRGNVADMEGKGIDIDLSSMIINRDFKWQVNLLYSYNTSKVTKYEVQNKNITTVVNDGTLISPVLGKPVYSIFSFKGAGLDPQNGNPLFLLDGKPSSDYTALYQSTDMNNVKYHGSALPTSFGAFRNNFTYKGVTVSANMIYKLGYYFRVPSISYSALFSQRIGNKDYNIRWQKPGDELITHVPSMVHDNNTLRDDTYLNSDFLVQKGDHIRLQDIVVSYLLKPALLSKWSIKDLEISAFMSNIGIIWRANDQKRDPDYISYYNLPIPRNYGLGLKCKF